MTNKWLLQNTYNFDTVKKILSGCKISIGNCVLISPQYQRIEPEKESYVRLIVIYLIVNSMVLNEVLHIIILVQAG